MPRLNGLLPAREGANLNFFEPARVTDSVGKAFVYYLVLRPATKSRFEERLVGS